MFGINSRQIVVTVVVFKLNFLLRKNRSVPTLVSIFNGNIPPKIGEPLLCTEAYKIRVVVHGCHKLLTLVNCPHHCHHRSLLTDGLMALPGWKSGEHHVSKHTVLTQFPIERTSECTRCSENHPS